MSDLLDISPLRESAADLVQAARAAGADSADAVAVRGVSRGVEVRGGKVEEIEHSESDDLGLRVFVGKRSAIVSTSAVDVGGFQELAERAVAMARIAPEDDYAGIADASLTGISEEELDLLDTTEVEIDTLREVALEAEDACLAVDGVKKSGGASASTGLGGVVLVSSNGFAGGYLRSRHGVSVSAIAGEGTGMQRDYDYASALHRGDLRSAVEIGKRAGERAVERLNPDKMETGRGDVVFDPRVAATLVSHLAGAVNGAAIARGTSMLKSRMGERIFSPGVVIVDDPLRHRGLASRPFDGDGIVTAPRTLVEDGVLKSWLLDLSTARELKLKTTGHAARGIGSAPSPSSTNLAMLPGTEAPDALIAGVKHGIYVTELIGRGANTVTGDYSRGAAGFRIRDGKLGEPVAEITIAGNLMDMFARLVPANDLEYRNATNAPTILVEGMTIAGR
ncbi:TldD/PmbA family protein [Tepidamorphus sp. 3E244]|uniref:TldD/PmbA family protein n=1 Tax=Tepidamorphus sp. 3E244 TaxID=3385498 RepID=UPI0038FC53EE